MKNIAAQLRSVKHRPLAGGVILDVHNHKKALLLQAIEGDDVTTAFVSHGQSVLAMHYGLWLSRSFISRPIVAGVAGIMIVMSGLLTTVSAAEQSLPGDVLYTVKLLNEKTQLQLASLDRRAVLHTEFAERRLQEVVQLQKESNVDRGGAWVAQTMDAYKNEITSANHNLQELQASGDVATVATASQVRQNLAALDSTITETNTANLTPEQSTAVNQAQTATQIVQENSVTVAVQAHQAANSEESTRELSEMFMGQFRAIETRRTFDLHRLSMMRALLQKHADIFAQTPATMNAEDLERLERSINIALADVGPAMDTFTIGNYRVAFDALQRVEDVLRGIEATIAEGEVSVTDILMSQTSLVNAPETSDAPSLPVDNIPSDVVVNPEVTEPQE